LILDGGISLANAIRKMRQERRACVVVVESEKLAGVFTERDTLMKVAATPIHLEGTRLEQVMTRAPVTLPADSSRSQENMVPASALGLYGYVGGLVVQKQ